MSPADWARVAGRPVEGTRVDLAAYVPAVPAIPLPKAPFRVRHPMAYYTWSVFGLGVGAVLAFLGTLYLIQWMLMAY